MESINNTQEKWKKPPRKPRLTYPGRLKDAWIAHIALVEDDCLILLNHYIAEQIREVGELFSKALKPSIPNLEPAYRPNIIQSFFLHHGPSGNLFSSL